MVHMTLQSLSGSTLVLPMVTDVQLCVLGQAAAVSSPKHILSSQRNLPSTPCLAPFTPTPPLPTVCVCAELGATIKPEQEGGDFQQD